MLPRDHIKPRLHMKVGVANPVRDLLRCYIGGVSGWKWNSATTFGTEMSARCR